MIEDIEQVGVNAGDSDGGGGGRPAWGPARILRITTSKGRFTTPARMVSRGEQAARSAIPLSRALPHALAMDFRIVRGSVVAGLAGAAGVDARARRLARAARLHRDITERALLRMSVFQPSQGALDGMTTSAKTRFADAQAGRLQGSLRSEITTYPYLGLPASDYLRFIRDRSARSEATTALFVLDMGMDSAALGKILGRLRADGGPVVVPMIYRAGAHSGLAEIRKCLGSPRMAFLACQVPRELPAGGGCSVSGLHAACFQQGFDMAAPAVRERRRRRRRRRLGRSPAVARAAEGGGPAKFFSPETWRIDALADAFASRGMRLADELRLNEHNGPDRRLVISLLEGHAAAPAEARGGAGDLEKQGLLAHLAAVHEAISSSAEFDRVRAAIPERVRARSAPKIALPQLVQG